MVILTCFGDCILIHNFNIPEMSVLDILAKERTPLKHVDGHKTITTRHVLRLVRVSEKALLITVTQPIRRCSMFDWG